MFLLIFLSERAFFLRQCYDLFAKIRYTMLQQRFELSGSLMSEQ